MVEEFGGDVTRKPMPRFASASRIEASSCAASATFWSLQDEARALPHHLVAEVEHAPVAADQDVRVDLLKYGMGQILVQTDHRVAQAEVVLEIGVDLEREERASLSESLGPAARLRPSPLLQDEVGAVRR